MLHYSKRLTDFSSFRIGLGLSLISLTVFCAGGTADEQPHHDHSHGSSSEYQWLAGDHHVHSHYSAGWRYKGLESDTVPPIAVIGGDAIYPIPKNVEMAKHYGLNWMVTTDHGGPHHSKLNFEQAYPDVVSTRKTNPDLILFYGMEFDTPGAEHSTLIIPHTHDEAHALYKIESQFNKREAFPADPSWDQESRMDEALAYMGELSETPIIIANHPSRTKKDGEYTRVSPSELRRWNDIAPTVAVGMEGSPGHQARALRPDGSLEPTAPRAGYKNDPTLGGFDYMTAKLGGFWDSMLGEGRRWWITANSDSHRNWRDGGDDFWPGEYSKTYVYAKPTYESVLNGIRNGRVFVTTGDLISNLHFSASVANEKKTVSLGEEIKLAKNQTIHLELGFKEADHGHSEKPQARVNHVDVIMGNIQGDGYSSDSDTNGSTRVLARLNRDQFKVDANGMLRTQISINDIKQSFYLRLRGTNTDQLEPEPDALGENPWQDLWFYSNPIFVSVVDQPPKDN